MYLTELIVAREAVLGVCSRVVGDNAVPQVIKHAVNHREDLYRAAHQVDGVVLQELPELVCALATEDVEVESAQVAVVSGDGDVDGTLGLTQTIRGDPPLVPHGLEDITTYASLTGRISG